MLVTPHFAWATLLLGMKPMLGIYGRRIAFEVAMHILVSLFAAATLFVAIDLVEAGNLAARDITTRELLELEFASLPVIVTQIMGPCIVIATVTAIAGLVRRREITAAFSSGASPLLVLRAMLVVGGFAALGAFFSVEWILPSARAEIATMRRTLGLSPDSRDALASRYAWFRGKTHLYRVDEVRDPAGRSIGGVLALRVDDGHLVDRIDASSLVWTDGRWAGRNVVRRSFDEEGAPHTRIDDAVEIALGETPETFRRFATTPDRLQRAGLSEAITARERVGRSTTRHRLELHRRFAFPATLFAAATLAAALALVFVRRGSTTLSLGIGASAAFAAWFVEDVGMALGSASILPPGAAAYLALYAALAANVWAWHRVLVHPIELT